MNSNNPASNSTRPAKKLGKLKVIMDKMNDDDITPTTPLTLMKSSKSIKKPGKLAR